MFYRLIEKKRNEWLASLECPVSGLLRYIDKCGCMRDVQADAIKTYLYLKIACGNRPLYRLFTEGRFNSLDMDSLELSAEARGVLSVNKAAAALMEYSRLKDRNGRQAAPVLERYIRKHAGSIDYEEVFRKIFYGVSYTDYLFSLPMGAGKTYLMAAFIYLDLYFAMNEPENPCFAHNFIVLAPSGLKASIVPSLKHIYEFDPSWVVPEPYATELRGMLKFEILDEQRSAKRSNMTKNPNAGKLNAYWPFDDLMGVVAVTNAEKVILDRVDAASDVSMYDKEEWSRIRQANELRCIIGKLPNLAVYIDEVHHASDGEIKLRQVVEGWTRESTFNCVLGFSGTPYLEKAESISVGEELNIKNTDLSNVVYHYPLIDGLGNFLKIPTVRYSNDDTTSIVRSGVKEFLDKYKDKVYSNGTKAKIAIYCGHIETLEETVYPIVSELAVSYGLHPSSAILRYHGGNKAHPQPEGAEKAFSSLDTKLSEVRIVLLVQIGKEGWDCKSLTSVILPQKGVCPMNMVLQTCCRCLRQVIKSEKETALIWLNEFNAERLNRQLRQRQDISLEEFGGFVPAESTRIERFSRMDRLKLPPVSFIQMRLSYTTNADAEQPDTATLLNSENVLKESKRAVVYTQDFKGNRLDMSMAEKQLSNDVADFTCWLMRINTESLNTLTMDEMKRFEPELKNIFEAITEIRDGVRYYSRDFAQGQIRSLVRKAFVPRRSIACKEECVP